MNILYFHQHFSTPSGSTANRSYSMAKALIDRGHQVTVVCGQYGTGVTGLAGEPVRGIREGEVDGIHIIEICIPYSNHDSLFKRSLTFLRFALKSTFIASRVKYDLLFATSTPLTAGIPGIVMRVCKPGKPFVFEVRDLWPELPREMGVITNPVILWGMSVLEWLTYRCASACVGLSSGISEGILKRSQKGKSVATIPNGCDLNLFKPRESETSEVEEGVKKFRAVFMGAHGMANGLDSVLDAASVLKGRGCEGIELVFLGDGKLKPELVERASKEELSNCTFLDPMSKVELTKEIQKFDVGLMILKNVPAFYYGTSPNKFFDYISAGLPVLNNYPGWLAELIQGHDCGIVVPPDDPAAFANALERMAGNKEEMLRMGSKARQLAEGEFDRRKLAGEFCEFLEKQITVS